LLLRTEGHLHDDAKSNVQDSRKSFAIVFGCLKIEWVILGIGIDRILKVISRSVSRDNSEDRKVSSRIPPTLTMEVKLLPEACPCKLLFARTSVFRVSGRHRKDVVEHKKSDRTRYHVNYTLAIFWPRIALMGKCTLKFPIPLPPIYADGNSYDGYLEAVEEVNRVREAGRE